MVANATQHCVSDADLATFHPPEGAVVVASAVESSENSQWSVEIDDDGLIAFAPLPATAFVCLHSARSPEAATTASYGGFERPSQSAQVPDKGIACASHSNPETNRLQEHFNVVVLDLSVAHNLCIDCQIIKDAIARVCAALVRQERDNLFQTAEKAILDCAAARTRITSAGECPAPTAASAPHPFLYMVQSATPAGKDGLLPTIYATLPGVKELNHSIVLPTVIPGDNASTAYAPSTARSQSVYNDHLSEGGNLLEHEATSPPAKSASRNAQSEPLTQSAPRDEEDTSSWDRLPGGAQEVIFITTCDSEQAQAQAGNQHQSRAEAQARQLAEAEAAALHTQEESQRQMRELKAALARESKARAAVANVGNLCKALSSAPFCGTHLHLHDTTVPIAPPSHTPNTSSSTWQTVAFIPVMKEITNTNVYTGLCSLAPPEATNRMFVVSGGGTKISSGTLELDGGDVLVFDQSCYEFSMADITVKGGMVLVHSAKKVILERCCFLDCTLVLVSGTDAKLKDTDFTQVDRSAYRCSLIVSGEDAMLSMHGGKITGGRLGIAVHGGATASLTEVTVEQISVSGVEAEGAATRVNLSSCTFQNFSNSGRVRTHAVHAHGGSSMHLDKVHIQGGDHIDYGVLVHTKASLCMRECTINGTKQCGAEISGGGTGNLTACHFEHNELCVVLSDHDSCCKVDRCTFQHAKTGVHASTMGKAVLHQCHAIETECGYRAASGATMQTSECTSQMCLKGWHADMHGTRLIARGCTGTDAGELIVHVAGGATADLNSCAFSRSKREVVLVESGGTFANIVGCTVSVGEGTCVFVRKGALACLKRCTLSNSKGWHGLDSHDSGTRVDVIDCVSEKNYRIGFTATYGSECLVSGCRSIGNGEHGYGAWHGGRMKVTDCYSEQDRDGGSIAAEGGEVTQERLHVEGE